MWDCGTGKTYPTIDYSIFAKIVAEDQKHIRETGWSYFGDPDSDEE